MKPTTISLLQKYKQEKKRFATITAYDYSFAKLFADEGLNVMLVGDSLVSLPENPKWLNAPVT